MEVHVFRGGYQQTRHEYCHPVRHYVDADVIEHVHENVAKPFGHKVLIVGHHAQVEEEHESITEWAVVCGDCADCT